MQVLCSVEELAACRPADKQPFAAGISSTCQVLLEDCSVIEDVLVQVLLSKGVEEGKILFLSLIAAPEGIHRICAAFPRVKLITSEIDEGIGPDFQVVPGKPRYSNTVL